MNPKNIPYKLGKAGAIVSGMAGTFYATLEGIKYSFSQMPPTIPDTARDGFLSLNPAVGVIAGILLFLGLMPIFGGVTASELYERSADRYKSWRNRSLYS